MITREHPLRSDQIGEKELGALEIPPGLTRFARAHPSSGEEIRKYEEELISFFTGHYRLFTPYEIYFKLRAYEFRIFRQLMPGYFDPARLHETILEIGCGFGYGALLLLPYCRNYLGLDIPGKWVGFVVGNFATSLDIAEFLIRRKMGIERAAFRKAWAVDTGLPAASVPLIFSEYTFNYIPQLDDAVREAFRILESGGVMIQILPNSVYEVWEFISSHINLTPAKIIDLVKRTFWRSLGKRERGLLPELRDGEDNSLWIRGNGRGQKEIYLKEKYLFALLEAGFTIEKISSIRESSNIIVARKP